MITDQKQTGVPSGSSFLFSPMQQKRSRMQLTKPAQTTNSGMVNPTTRPSQNSNLAQTQTNPLLKRTDGTPNAVVAPTIQQTQQTSPTQNYYGDATDFTDSKGETLYQSHDLFPGQSVLATKSNMDQARDLIGKMSDDDIMTLLDEIANGALKGYSSTMTGEPGSGKTPEYTPATTKSPVTDLGQLMASRK